MPLVRQAVKCCFVPNCHSTSKKTPDKIFITVPREERRKFLWFVAVGRTVPLSQTVFYCCDNHFKFEEDVKNYIRYKLVGGRIFLKKHVVPHIFGNEGERTPASDLLQRDSFKVHEEELCDKTAASSSTSFYSTAAKSTNSNSNNISYCLLLPQSIQNFEKDQPNFSVTKEELYTSKNKMCNIISSIIKQPELHVGLPNKWFAVLLKLLQNDTNLPTEHILLTLMKIKMNDSFAKLGILFRLTESQASDIFDSCIKILAATLKQIILWPKDSTRYLLPLPLRARCINVQSIIRRLKIPMKNSNGHSGMSFITYLVSCTLDGLITFVSLGFTGFVSKRYLLEESGYLDQIPPGSTVILNDDFQHFQKLIEERNCTVVQISELSNFVEVDVALIMSHTLRVNLERITLKLREFEYLNQDSVIRRPSKTNDVVTIACALINLQKPIC